MNTADFLSSLYKREGFSAPALHIVLGSGLSAAFREGADFKGWKPLVSVPFGEAPGLVPSTAPGHKGVFRYYQHTKSGGVVCFQVGRLHGYEGLTARQVVQPVVAAALAGTSKFLLTNAAGSLKKKFGVGSLMLINDQVNLSGGNPLSGPNPVDGHGAPLGPRFPDMSEVYSPKFRARLKKTLAAKKFKVNEGVYLGLSGPVYETPSEVKLFASWGMGAVGMSTVWEAIALRHMGREVGGLSFISNLGCGLGGKKVLKHEDVEKEGKKIAIKLVDALFDFAAKELS